MDAVNTDNSTVQVKCQRCPLTLQLSSQLQFTFYSSHIINHHDEKSLIEGWTGNTRVHDPKGTKRGLRAVASLTQSVATGHHRSDCVFNLMSPETLKDSHPR